ncbi:bifunctional riboflavin kinase/FAD synthetase [uncultured Pseudokineococcus sp.]|uniref:bifunctional riboflavin kinase/FAD synthetase n=1 Tax=uncultured Pseudokineococcus sp. TaxID=1642928 RepID=UPI002605BA15|nr:bifunctional riboflavin kinase/FAD synthetase [uncultured Pseudokineococcus sp.]
MERWYGAEQVPSAPGGSVVAVGNFDGVHRGHRVLLEEVVRVARERGLRALAVTFNPHPLHVLHPDRAPALLTGLPERLELLGGTGLDGVVVLPFAPALAARTPREWVAEDLVRDLGARVLVVGHDVRFGAGNAGDLAVLRELAAELDVDVVVLDDAVSAGRRWSSSWVRELLAAGDARGAADVLGRPHRVVGEVVHGDHRGRELGYPTANLSSEAEGLVPADGVYAGWLTALDGGAPGGGVRPGERRPAAVSIGTNPTFDGLERRVEAYVLDVPDGSPLDLYGVRVRVELVERLRETLRFDGVEALCAQMARDVDRARDVLAAAASAEGRRPLRP